MEFGSVIKTAWSITWRHRFLWVLGLFAASGTASTFYNLGRDRREPGGTGAPFGPPGEGDRWAVQANDMAQGAILWFQTHPAVVGGAVFVAVLVTLAVVVVSVISQGGMAVATVNLARGHSASLGRAWDQGRQLFWRFVRLWLGAIVVAVAGAILTSIAVSILVVIASVPAVGADVGARISAVITVLLGLLAIPYSIVVTFALRLVALEHAGTWPALRQGWELMRAHWRDTIAAWVLNAVLAIGLAIGIGLVAAVLAGVLGVIGFGIWSTAGLTGVLTYASFGLLVFIAGLWLTAAIVNTFFWSYWSLVYLKFQEGTHEPQAAGTDELPRAA